jgi:hypothetical protein
MAVLIVRAGLRRKLERTSNARAIAQLLEQGHEHAGGSQFAHALVMKRVATRPGTDHEAEARTRERAAGGRSAGNARAASHGVPRIITMARR